EAMKAAMKAPQAVTLTSVSGPREKVAGIAGVSSAKVDIVFDPPWTQDMMSEEAKLELGFL
ncbi:MAG: hypothetical protein AAF193_07915, partial [Bacteroidota bacterium]